MKEQIVKGARTLAGAIVRRNSRLRGWLRERRLIRSSTDWRPILGRSAPLPSGSTDGPRVLLATSVGSYLAGSTLESILAAALKMRGAEVHVFLCDSDLPACMACTIGRFGSTDEMVMHGPRREQCPGCFTSGVSVYAPLGVNIHAYGGFLTDGDRAEAASLARNVPADEISKVVDHGIAVGEHALAGALRFFARATLEGEPSGEVVLRRYLEAAILTARATARLMRTVRFECAVFHHGIYVPQGTIGEVARSCGVRVVNWMTAYRNQSFVFSHDDTYHHTLLTEPTSAWSDLEWNDDLDQALMVYLRSRWQGSADWVTFHSRSVEDGNAIFSNLGIDPRLPCVGMLTNVMWDAQLHYPANAFANMLDWVVQTVEYFRTRSDLQLLIRVHPAEITGLFPSRQPIVKELTAAFPEWPPNVFLIPPESDYSTYAAMLKCNSVLIYGTKTGVELAPLGIPVVVAGEAWIRGKGITIDVSSVAEYLRVLDRLPFAGGSDEATVLRAKRYAFHFFFRRMIPLEFIEPSGGPHLFRFAPADLAALEVGKSPGLDVICDGILHRRPFVYPAEVLADARQRALSSSADDDARR